MTIPNFLIIGSQKCGTTSVYNYLRQHPQVFLSPIKETNFFVHAAQNPDILPYLPKASLPVQSLEAYRVLFGGALTETAVGEASHLYLIDPRAADQIRAHLPRARLIAVLRDPVERAFSAYWMRVRDGRETRSFEQAVEDEKRGRFEPLLDLGGRFYVRTGFYARHLKPYLRMFDRSQIAILLFDDLEADASGFMRQLFAFLEVDGTFAPETSVRHNASGLPRHGVLQPLLHKNVLTRTVRRVLPEALGRRAATAQDAWRSRQLAKPTMSPDLRRALIAKFKDDIFELQDITGRDLSRWLA
jgi:hypothetical protein